MPVASILSVMNPNFEDVSGSIKVLRGSYDRGNYEAVLNLPLTDTFATRWVSLRL